MNELELYAVLDRATDGIEPLDGPQHAAMTALSQARAVRTLRRGLAAGAVAAAVLVVWVAVGLHGSDRAAPPIAPSPPAHGIADQDVQQTFDPRTASSLPQASSVLPSRLEPSRTAGDLPSSGPVRLALAVGEARFSLLVEDGTWVTTRSPAGETYTSGLSDDGTMLAAVGPQGLWVVDVQDGTWRQLALSENDSLQWTGLDTRVSWQDDHEVVLTNPGGILMVSTDTPTTPQRVTPDRLTLLPQGYVALGEGRAIVPSAGRSGLVIVDVRDGKPERLVPADAIGRLSFLVANDDRIVATSPGIVREDRPTQHSGIMVLDRDSYDATAYLPIARTRYEPGIGGMSPDGLRPWGWLDANTALLGHQSNRGQDWTLTAWNVESGDLSLVATGQADAYLVAVAADLVRG